MNSDELAVGKIKADFHEGIKEVILDHKTIQLAFYTYINIYFISFFELTSA